MACNMFKHKEWVYLFHRPWFFFPHEYSHRRAAARSIYLLPCRQEFQTLGFYLPVGRYQNCHCNQEKENEWYPSKGIVATILFHENLKKNFFFKFWDGAVLVHSSKQKQIPHFLAGRLGFCEEGFVSGNNMEEGKVCDCSVFSVWCAWRGLRGRPTKYQSFNTSLLWNLSDSTDKGPISQHFLFLSTESNVCINTVAVLDSVPGKFVSPV